MKYVITKDKISDHYIGILEPNTKYKVLAMKKVIFPWDVIYYDYNPKEYKFDIIVEAGLYNNTRVPNNLFLSTEEIRTLKINKII